MTKSPITLLPDWDAQPSPLRPTWEALANIDQFRWLSRADVQSHLAMARDELGVRHVRAVAMYSPEMCVWDSDLADWQKPAEEKSKRTNWQLVDIAIEGLLSLGLKPIYTTCFIPQGMTDDTCNCWPDKNPTGMPRDLSQWQEFVADGIRHHIERYGIDEVRSWYFECWNEPNLRGCFFGGSKEDFFRLWSATWHAVKGVDPALQFGGPSTARGEWVLDFLDFAEADGTPPDYLITHVYNNDSASQPLSPFDGPASHKVVDSPHFASGVVRGTRKALDARGYKGELHWNEWGRSWFPYDPLKETALEAAFIVKTMAEVSQEADAFAFWCLSDVYNQAGFQSSEFGANYGMLSLHGLRKPAWFAHMLLRRLGSARVDVSGTDDLLGALATKEGSSAKLLLYAYPTQVDAATEFCSIRIALPPQTRQATLYRIGQQDNNIIDTWRKAGANPYPTPAQLHSLRQLNTLTPCPPDAIRLESDASGLFASFTIERPGVALLELQ